MKPVSFAIAILVTLMSPTANKEFAVLYERRFNYVVLSSPPGVAPGQTTSELSDPPDNLYKVTQKEEGMVEDIPQIGSPHNVVLFAGRSVPQPDDEVLSGVELCLNTDTDSGFVLVRDDVPRHLIDGAFTVLAVLGWQPIDDDEATEPYEFNDGGVGVQIWLYRTARPLSAIVRDVTATKAA